MHCTPQDAVEAKAQEKALKIRQAAEAKAQEESKKKAKAVVDMLSSPLLLFEAAVINFNNTRPAGNSYLANSSVMLLDKVKDWIAQAGDAMLGKGPADFSTWNMEEIKLAKSQMISNTRTA